LVGSLGFPRPIIKSDPEEKVGVAQGHESFPIFGVPFNISATNEVSDFKIGRPVNFAIAHHKIPPRRIVGVIMN